MRRTTPALASMTVMAVLLAGCSNDAQQDAPEPTPDNIKNGTNTQVIQMPDGFRNIAFTCHGTTGLYVTSRGAINSSVSKEYTPLPSAVTAVPSHPLCTR